MGNFCARCGRPLQGGEVCNCMTQNTFYGGQQGQVQASASQSQMGYQIPPVQPQMGYQMPPLQQTTGQSASGRQGTGGKADQITGNLLGILKRPVTMGSEAIAVADLKCIVCHGRGSFSIYSGQFGFGISGRRND